MKKVTAVLPARNCRRELHRCLSALSRGDFVPDVIVVDDGSDDGTQQMIKEEREIADWSLYQLIIDDFKQRFCIMVY